MVTGVALEVNGNVLALRIAGIRQDGLAHILIGMMQIVIVIADRKTTVTVNQRNVVVVSARIVATMMDVGTRATGHVREEVLVRTDNVGMTVSVLAAPVVAMDATLIRAAKAAEQKRRRVVPMERTAAPTYIKENGRSIARKVVLAATGHQEAGRIGRCI